MLPSSPQSNQTPWRSQWSIAKPSASSFAITVCQLVLWHESWRFTDRSRFITTAPLQRQVQVEMPAGKGASVRWVLSAREAETLAK